MLGDDERPIRLDLQDGIADVGQVGDALPIRLRIPSGALRAALDDVARHDAGREQVAIGFGPAEAVDHGGQRQRGVGAAAGDDDIRAGGEGIGQRERAEVGVRAQHAVADTEEQLAGIEVAQFATLGEQLVDAGEDVVAQHHGDLQLGRKAPHLARAGNRVHAAGVGNHLDAAFANAPGQARHQRRKIARIAEGRILPLLLLKDGHGDFGQVVEREVVDGTLLDQAHRSFQPVTPKALTVGDADHMRRRQPPADRNCPVSRTACSRCRR